MFLFDLLFCLSNLSFFFSNVAPMPFPSPFLLSPPPTHVQTQHSRRSRGSAGDHPRASAAPGGIRRGGHRLRRRLSPRSSYFRLSRRARLVRWKWRRRRSNLAFSSGGVGHFGGGPDGKPAPNVDNGNDARRNFREASSGMRYVQSLLGPIALASHHCFGPFFQSDQSRCSLFICTEN